MHRRPATTTLLAVAVWATSVAALAGCSTADTGSAADGNAVVEQLESSTEPGARGAPTTGGRATATPTTPTTETPTTGTPTARSTTDQDDATLALVQAVLDRYDAALTTVAQDPLAVVPGHPGHPGLEGWNAVVAPGSFSAAMLADLADRATTEAVVVVPGPSGRSYRHQVLRAVEDGPTVSFTWCGHSPGVGIDVTTRAVVDDAVALSRGTGALSYDGGVWRVVTLDAVDVEVAAAGTVDPCPAQLAATRAATESSEVTE